VSPQFDQGLQDALDAADPTLDADRFVEEVGEAFQQDAEPQAQGEGGDLPPVKETATDTAEEEPAGETEGSPSVDAPPQVPSFVEVGGVQIPVDKAEAVANFYAWSQTPQGQPWVQALSEAMEKGIDPRSIIGDDRVVTRPPPPPAPEAPPEPEFFEPETAYKTLQERLDTLSNLVESREAQVRAATQAQISFLVDSVREEFAAQHELNPEEARQLVDHMDRTTVLAGYQTDPATGTQRDARATLLAAMDAAYWAHPTLREKEVARMQSEQKDRSKKDRKLAAVGGTSGSVPHRPEPTTPEERDAQAVEIIANAMGMKA
jgi:hypothetical protein